MSDRPFEAALGRYADATEPTDAVCERAEARIGEATGERGTVLAGLPAPADPTELAAERVRQRVQRSRNALEPAWSPSWIGGARPRPPWRAPAFAAAALAALAIALLWARGPEPAPAPVASADPEVERVELRPDRDAPVSYDSIPGVRIVADGQGSVAGTHSRPLVSWRRGRLDVEVEPGAGVGLVVQTDEAAVHVVGTGFGVDRDLLGTTTRVHHGRVRVACRGSSPRLLDAGESVTCLPVTSSGLLGRARTLARRGAPVGEVLAAVDGGLAAGDPTDPIHGELLYLRMRTLDGAGRAEEARAAARRYVEGGQLPRRAEALRRLEESP